MQEQKERNNENSKKIPSSKTVIKTLPESNTELQITTTVINDSKIDIGVGATKKSTPNLDITTEINIITDGKKEKLTYIEPSSELEGEIPSLEQTHNAYPLAQGINLPDKVTTHNIDSIVITIIAVDSEESVTAIINKE